MYVMYVHSNRFLQHTVRVKKTFPKTFHIVLQSGTYRSVSFPFLAVVPFGFERVSFRFVSFRVVSCRFHSLLN